MTRQKYINMSSPDIQYNVYKFIVATEKNILDFEMNSYQGSHTVRYFQYNFTFLRESEI